MYNNENSEAVTVSVRIRPLLHNENKNIIEGVENDPKVIIVQDTKNIFAFDHVFDTKSTQLEVYNNAVKPLIEKVISGFNCTVLAYGQTGTGKTFTMGTDPQEYSDDTGLIPKLLDDFLEYVNLDIKCSLSVSFIEIYNEKVYDLLGNNPSAFLNVKGFKIQNMTCVNVKDASQAYHWLNIGSKMRHKGYTNLNKNSSRSHAVFTIYFTSVDGVQSKFHLVDLAGSESVRRTGNEGKAFKEGVTINKGLLTVGKVINALLKNKKVIPYRESMLTTILQDSLNVKNYVVLVFCVSPNADDIYETLTTLKFAEKTRVLRSKPQLEIIATNFEKTHPGKIEKVDQTAYKRKHANPQGHPSTIKKKLKTINNFQNSFAPSFSITSSPKSEDNDTLSFSHSTSTEHSQFSFSPIVKQCADRIEATVVQTQLAIIKTPLMDKTNLNSFTPTTKNRINQIIRQQLIELTQKMPEIPNKIIRSQLTSKRFLDFNENSPLTEKLDVESSSYIESRSSIFKVPAAVPKSMPVRRSTRISISQMKDLASTSCPIPVFIPKRRSVRLSIKRSMLPPPIPPTPAPRRKTKSFNSPPKPAPRRTMMKIPTPNTFLKPIIKSKKTTKMQRRKSYKSQHYDYVLETINSGSLKEMQMLPTVGMKTAIQITTYRNMHGLFKDFEDLEKMIWRGTGFERFMIANQLESFM